MPVQQLREEGNQPLPEGLGNAALWPSGGNNDAIECASHQRIDSRFVSRLNGFQCGVKGIERHLAIGNRLTLEVDILARCSAMHGDLVGWLKSLIYRGHQGHSKTGDSRNVGADCQPAAKRGAPHKANDDAIGQPDSSPQPRMQIVANGITLGIKSGFVQGSFVGFCIGGVGHIFLSLVMVAAAPASSLATGLGCASPVRLSSFFPAGWLIGNSIIADTNAGVLGMTAGETAPISTGRGCAVKTSSKGKSTPVQPTFTQEKT